LGVYSSMFFVPSFASLIEQVTRTDKSCWIKSKSCINQSPGLWCIQKTSVMNTLKQHESLFRANKIYMHVGLTSIYIRVITKLPNSEQSYKGKVKTHNYINRQNQSTTGKLWKP
jgi:hypothetical protein